MGLTIAWAIYVTVLFWWAETLAPEELGILMQFTIPGWPHELVGGFLSILLVFRTDQAYDRSGHYTHQVLLAPAHFGLFSLGRPLRHSHLSAATAFP